MKGKETMEKQEYMIIDGIPVLTPTRLLFQLAAWITHPDKGCHAVKTTV